MPVGTRARPPPGVEHGVLAGHQVGAGVARAGRRRAAAGRGRGGRPGRRARRVKSTIRRDARVDGPRDDRPRPGPGTSSSRSPPSSPTTSSTIVAEGPDLVVHQPPEALAAHGRRRAHDAHTQRAAGRHRGVDRLARGRGRPDARVHQGARARARAPCRCAATPSAPTGASSPPTCPRSRTTCTTARSTCRRSRSWPGAGTPRRCKQAPAEGRRPPRPRRHPRERGRAGVLPVGDLPLSGAGRRRRAGRRQAGSDTAAAGRRRALRRPWPGAGGPDSPAGGAGADATTCALEGHRCRRRCRRASWPGWPSSCGRRRPGGVTSTAMKERSR